MDQTDQLLTSEGPELKQLLTEYQNAGASSNGAGNMEFAENTRRMRWPGQSPDGRKWDENQPEGELVLPWNGCSDTKVSTVDEVINDNVAVNCVGFRKAEIHAGGVEFGDSELASYASTYLRWLVRSRLKRALKVEVELAAQYSQEYSWCAAYVGWEREIGKRRVTVTMEQLLAMSQAARAAREQAAAQGVQNSELLPYETLPQLITDPTQETAAAELVKELYWFYVQNEMAGKGFLDSERAQDDLLELSDKLARKYVRELRTSGTVQIPMPYVCKNDPFVMVLKPWEEILVSDSAIPLEKQRVIFWRQGMNVADLLAMKADGWDERWIAEAIKTKGMVSSWIHQADGPSKTVGGDKWFSVKAPESETVEVVHAFVRKADEDGVTCIWHTVFSPHISRGPNEQEDFVAKHEPLEFLCGQMPFRALKRENIGRGLEQTRSVPEIANTWQAEEKNQRDMLFNRAQLDTLPPIEVPKLGGMDYRLGPAAQVPKGRADSIKAIDLGGRQPTLAIELLNYLERKTDNYFGRVSEHVPAFRVQTKQEMMFSQFVGFWEEIFTMMFALAAQFDIPRMARLCGIDPQQLQGIDPYNIMEELDLNIQFDVRELDPDYLTQKLEILHTKILPADRTGAVDNAALTEMEMRMLDPILARKLVQDRATASQKLFKDVQNDLVLMFTGNEPNYGQDADPAAPTKMQFLQQIVSSNPKFMMGLQQDPDFAERVKKYTENLQFNIQQQDNKTVGRVGVK